MVSYLNVIGKTACHINHSDAGFHFHFLFERLFCPLFQFYSCFLSLSLFSLNGIIPVSFLLQIHFHSLHLFKVFAGENSHDLRDVVMKECGRS